MAEKNYTLSEAIKVGLRHHRAGRFGDAEYVYRKVLKAQPENAHALHLLGLIAHKKGDSASSIQLISKAIHHNPRQRGFFNDLGEVFRTSKQFPKAIQFFQEALKIDPQYAEAHCNLGNAYKETGMPDAAMACYQKAVEIKPAYAKPYYNMGIILRESGKLHESVASFQKAIKIEPGYAAAYCNMGNAFKNQGETVKAAAAYRRAIKLAPSLKEAHYNLGIVLKFQGMLENSLACYEEAIRLDPNYADAHNNMGNVFLDQSRISNAKNSFRRAIKIKPDFIAAHNNLANALKEEYRIEDAIASYRRAIDIEPDNVEALYNLSQIHRFKPEEPELAALERAINQNNTSEEFKGRLLFALGKAHDDLGDFEKAFSFYEQGNCKFEESINYSEKETESLCADLREYFPEKGEPEKFGNDDDTTSIFLVGLSRSGKSLMENLLVEHKDVLPGYENNLVARELKRTLSEAGINSRFPQCLDDLNEGLLGKFYTQYQNRIRDFGGRTPFFTTTNPSNYIYLGLILKVFPKTRVVYCRRNVLDNCLKIYFKKYNNRHDYSYRMSSVAHYVLSFQKMMDHWVSIFGDDILCLDYEELVKNPEDALQKTARFCGLNNPLPASSMDINTGEIGAWKNYEKLMAPLFDALKNG